MASNDTLSIVARNPSVFRIRTRTVQPEAQQQPTQQTGDDLTVLSGVANVVDSAVLERSVLQRVETALAVEDEQHDAVRLRKVLAAMDKAKERLRLAKGDTTDPELVQRIMDEIKGLKEQADFVERCMRDRQRRKQQQVRPGAEGEDDDDNNNANGDGEGNGEAGETDDARTRRKENEQREQLIRMGKLTPFDRIDGKQRTVVTAPAPSSSSSSSSSSSARLPPKRPPQQHAKGAAKKKKRTGPAPAAENDDDDDGDGEVVRCPCGATSEPNLTVFMIECEKCKAWQHGRCVGVSEASVPETYECLYCRAGQPAPSPSSLSKKRKGNTSDNDDDDDDVDEDDDEVVMKA